MSFLDRYKASYIAALEEAERRPFILPAHSEPVYPEPRVLTADNDPGDEDDGEVCRDLHEPLVVWAATEIEEVLERWGVTLDEAARMVKL